MPTKRTKTSRNPLLITPEMAALYKTGLRTKPCWDACHADSAIRCEHAECAEYYKTLHELNMAFNILPHQPSPLESWADIRSLSDVYPPGCGGRDNSRTMVIKQALDAELAAGEDRKND